MAADGAMEVMPKGDILGCTLVADSDRVLATVASGIQTRAASTWATEWAGKLEAGQVAKTLGVTPAAVQYVEADCTSATLGSDGGVPSQSPLVDRVQVAFVEAPGRRRRCMCQHITTPSGRASCPTSRYATTTWRRRHWAWRARARTRSQAPWTGRLSYSHRATW